MLRMVWFAALVWLVVSGKNGAMEVAPDGRDGGFFVRTHLVDDHLPEEDQVLRYAPLRSNAAFTLRAQFGPFTSRQTVHAAPHPSATTNSTSTSASTNPGAEFGPPPPAEITARLVTREVRRDRPVLRVLFHTDPKGPRAPPDRGKPNSGGVCVVLYVHHRDQHLMAACSPSEGACLAQATLPVAWWPPLESWPAWKGPKAQRTWVRVEYALLRTGSVECTDSAGLPVSVPAGLPGTYLGDVPLSGAHGSYEEVKSDDVVRILVPQGPVYPRSKVYVPVYLKPNPVYPPYVFVIRAKVKNGLRILGAQVSPPSQWSITVELNPRQTVATVTAFVKDTSTKAPSDHQPQIKAEEVFTWLLEVEEGNGDDGRITWQLRYMLDSNMAERYDFDDDDTKITSRLDIRKDDVQAVLPIAKSSQLLNTAVLNGRQASQPMKVFVVSQAGKVGDVTLQSSCHAADESILKVSPSCTSVYLDGSEIRGSQNASVLVKYGTYTGEAHFVVWMPEFPLTVRISDSKLSQVKGWRTPHLHRTKTLPTLGSRQGRVNDGRSTPNTRKNRWADKEDLDIVCRLRYQQASVEVYTRFFSVDHNSGRESYLLSRKAELRITELVAPFVRVADTRIASLRGTIVRGLQSGRTEVQVLSPITGRVSGAKEVRVGTDKETITHLEVTVVAGLHLALTPDENFPGVFTARTIIDHKLTSQYQEGLLNIRIHFSDGTSTPVADVSDTDYRLSVDTFDGGVVAFAPAAGLRYPRVIAIGKGKGELLHVTVELAERCQKRRSQPLAMAYAYVDVDFSADKTVNDFRGKGSKGGGGATRKKPDVDMKDSGESSFLDAGSVPYRDAVGQRGKAHYHEPAVQARQNLVHPSELTPLEIGMYSLLGVFCLAILVFLVSCSVFAVRYRRKQVPPVTSAGDSVAHAHDWVWLGRATLERNSVNTRCSQTLVPMADFNGNHERPAEPPKVARPLSGLSFPGSEIGIRITANPQQAEDEEPRTSTPQSFRVPDSTVSREKRVRIVTNPVPPPLPPDSPLKLFPARPPPPVPPHRNFAPPPVPPHQRHLKEGKDIPKARVAPKNAAAVADWEKVAQGMNYDQLIEYFENLKESNA